MATMSKKIDGQFVVPGERLGVVEEFDAGTGTVDVNGTVRAISTVKTRLQRNRRKVMVKTLAGPPVVPEEGSSIIGMVEKIQEKMAIVNIIMIDNHKVERPFTGLLHISNSSPRYERAMGEVCKPVDLIRAKVIDVSARIPKLTTSGRGLGVIKAYCSNCGANWSSPATS